MGDILADMKIEVPPIPTLPDVFMNLTKLTHSIGSLLELDDLKDYGRFSFPEHPSMIHHWWIGAIIREVSELAGAGLVMWGAKAAMEEEEKKDLLQAFNFTKHDDLLNIGRKFSR